MIRRILFFTRLSLLALALFAIVRFASAETLPPLPYPLPTPLEVTVARLEVRVDEMREQHKWLGAMIGGDLLATVLLFRKKG